MIVATLVMKIAFLYMTLQLGKINAIDDHIIDISAGLCFVFLRHHMYCVMLRLGCLC